MRPASASPPSLFRTNRLQILASLAFLVALVLVVSVQRYRGEVRTSGDIPSSSPTASEAPPTIHARALGSVADAGREGFVAPADLAPTPRARFRGRIFERTTDRGLAGATVVAVRASAADGYPIDRGEREPELEEVLLARATTNSDGRFVLRPPVEEEVSLVCVHVAGYVATVVTAGAFADGHGVEVPLDPGVSFHGRIVASDQTPLADELVCCTGTRNWWQWRIGGNPRSGVDGRYVLVDLLALSPVVPTKSTDNDADGAEDWLPAGLMWVPVNGGFALVTFPTDEASKDFPDEVRVPIEPYVTGVVRDTTGRPVWTAEVVIDGECASGTGDLRSCVSCRRDGSFRVDAPSGVPSGERVTKWMLRVAAPGYRSVERVLPDGEKRSRLEIVLEPGVAKTPDR